MKSLLNQALSNCTLFRQNCRVDKNVGEWNNYFMSIGFPSLQFPSTDDYGKWLQAVVIHDKEEIKPSNKQKRNPLQFPYVSPLDM